MTTLPQTQPMRLPRPSSSHLAIPSANGLPVPAAGHPMTPGLTFQDVWRIVRANMWLIIGMVAVFAVAGYFVNKFLLANYPRFNSTALIRVQLRSELPAVGDESHVFNSDPGPQAIELEQQSQASMLTNKYFLGNILSEKDNPIRKTGWFKQWGDKIEDAKEDLVWKLEVTPKPNTRLIGVSMSTGSPEDSITIVRQVVEHHIKDCTARVQDMEYAKSTDLGRLIDTYDNTLRDIQSQINVQSDRISQLMGTSSSYGLSGLDVMLSALMTSQVKAEKDLREADSEYKDFVDQVKQGLTPAKLQELISRMPASPAQQQADMIRTELDAMRVKFGAESQQVRMLQEQLKSWEPIAEERQAETHDKAVASYQQSLASAKHIAEEYLASLTKQLDQVKVMKQQQADAQIRMKQLEDEQKNILEQKQKRQNEKRSVSLALGSNNWSTAEIAMDPELPDKPSFPRLSITMTLAVVLGLMVSLGIAFLREFTDTSVRSPRDIAKIGQLNLLGMIPHEADDPEAQGARLPLAIFEAPTSIIAEQFRQVRTRLQHSASLDTVRSLMVTGTAPGDGKTTVACNLAAGLALNGRRILLVDANFRRPQVHAVLNIPNEIGFGDVLNSLDLFNSAVRPTEVPNLSVLPTGVKPANSTELLESQLLIDFIERALEEYDHVIFDSGPLLLVSETAALAPRVDGVVTVVRARGNSRGMLQRLRDQLRQLKAENMGVILNAVRSQTGGYYAPMIKSYYAYQNGHE